MRQQRCNDKAHTNEASVAACRKQISSTLFQTNQHLHAAYLESLDSAHIAWEYTSDSPRLIIQLSTTLMSPLDDSHESSRRLSRVLSTTLMHNRGDGLTSSPFACLRARRPVVPTSRSGDACNHAIRQNRDVDRHTYCQQARLSS